MTRQLATATARRALEMCLVGVLAAASTATQADAQTSVIITACYPKPAKNGAPGSGVVYRINKLVGSAPASADWPAVAPATWNSAGLRSVRPAPMAGQKTRGCYGLRWPRGSQRTAGDRRRCRPSRRATGPAGPQGAQGTTGSQGPSGVSGYAFQQEIYVSTPPGLSSKGMYCPDGKLVLERRLPRRGQRSPGAHGVEHSY